ncbi:MAG: prenyltransferase/squalene oxidase repeat-containing protein [Planctomycetaceae bacterium]
MPAEPYLLRLESRLQRGLAGPHGLSPDRIERHRSFILKHQQPDGGFRGREGESDLYYSAFAIRALGLLGGLRPEERPLLEEYLRRHDWRKLGVIDLMNWLTMVVAVQAAGGEDLLADAEEVWLGQMLQSLEALRRPDGGYAKTHEGATGSTYHSFLVLLTYELLAATPPLPNRLAQFFFNQQRDDGGFVEIAPMRRSGTNPTAAAVASLTLLGHLSDELSDDVSAFLKDVRSDEGGFQANTRIPFADSLSTFTGLLTAQDIGRPGVIDLDRIQEWVTTQLEFPTGGFRAATWDEQADIEYSFYALGLLGLLGHSMPPE